MADNVPHDPPDGAPHDMPVKGAGDVPHAVLVRRKRTHVSVVWIIPVLAAVIAFGIAIQRILAEGPTVTIVFSAGQGVEAGKTLLKYKDVKIGQVSSMEFLDHYSKVLVTARVTRSAAGLMVDGTRFWVVSPHIGLTGISGLSTLLSGNYIGVQPGTSDRPARHFTGLDAPPQITDQQGRRFVLSVADLGSLEIGSPIYYKFLPVGQVESYHLAADGRSFEISAFINAPFDQQVHSETRFWNASGLDVSVGENGIDVKTVSLLALLAGGLCFDTPDFAASTPPAAAGASFKVFATRVVAMKQPERFSRQYILSFHEPVRGLSVGASVTLMGLVVGEVADIGLHYNPHTLAIHPLVRINFYPEEAARLFPPEQQGPVRRHTEQDAQMVAMLRHLVDERGMRARLRTASLLTGQRYVSFEFDAKAPQVRVDWTRDPLELPVAPGEIEDLEAKLESILGKVDQMPIATIGERTSIALKTLNRTLHEAGVVLQDVDTSALPQVRKALDDLDRALGNANATLLGKDAPGQEALREALEEVANTARSLRALTDYLERHPEALIRGRVGEPK
jgi:paraquat-inducible protein B